MLQAELGLGDSGRVCQLVLQNAGSCRQFHEMPSCKVEFKLFKIVFFP
jgi:hypothetical protein